MYLEAIEHIMNSPYAHAISENVAVIRLRAKKGDLRECLLFYGDQCLAKEPLKDWVAMECVATDQLFDYFEVEITIDYPQLCYYFRLSDGDKTLFYYGDKFYKNSPQGRPGFYRLHYLRREEIARTPEWAKEAIIYQIFPDSFATSRAFISGLARRLPNQFGNESYSKNGGTLPGICDNLFYLSELGITCLYLNPLFTSPSWHKYDTEDYFSIDPCFGETETLKELVRKAHQLGIRVILDAVFNHCGTNFFAFKDLMEKGPDSRYKDWFYQVRFPLIENGKPNYACFKYRKEMPKLNTGHPEVRDYLIKVGAYWTREADIDGWRMDVADEVDHFFWKYFRKAIKGIKPDAFLIGEIWEDARPWLEGDEFDSTMNYPFAKMCRQFFAERTIGAADFDAELHRLRMRYRKNMTYAQMNLLDSHDIPRFLHWCGEDIHRLKLAVLFQMMAEGIPSIYYGDEKAITGFKEAEYRRPMVWDDSEKSRDLFTYYQKVIGIRKSHYPAMVGEYKTLLTDSENGIYGFSRGRGLEQLIILLNNSDVDREVAIPVNGSLNAMADLLSGRDYSVTGACLKFILPAMNGVVLATDGKKDIENNCK